MAINNIKETAAGLFWVFLLIFISGCASTNEKSAHSNDLSELHREAQLAYDNGDDARAELIYKRLTMLGKQDAETWLRLGNIYARNNKSQSAEEAYRTSLLINDSDPRTWNNLGIVLLRQSWISLIQANSLSNPKEPAYSNSIDIIKVLERLPVIQSEKTK